MVWCDSVTFTFTSLHLFEVMSGASGLPAYASASASGVSYEGGGTETLLTEFLRQVKTHTAGHARLRVACVMRMLLTVLFGVVQDIVRLRCDIPHLRVLFRDAAFGCTAATIAVCGPSDVVTAVHMDEAKKLAGTLDKSLVGVFSAAESSFGVLSDVDHAAWSARLEDIRFMFGREAAERLGAVASSSTLMMALRLAERWCDGDSTSSDNERERAFVDYIVKAKTKGPLYFHVPRVGST
jgi:hypothetical protein